MFTQKNTETGKLKLSTLTKGIASALVIIGSIAGSVILMEDRYIKSASADEKFKIMEASNVKTFQMYQEGLEMKQKAAQKRTEMRLLEDYYDHRIFLKDALRRSPNDPLLRDRLNRLNRKIQALERKVY